MLVYRRGVLKGWGARLMWFTQVQSDEWMHKACAQSQGIGKEQGAGAALEVGIRWALVHAHPCRAGGRHTCSDSGVLRTVPGRALCHVPPPSLSVCFEPAAPTD